MSRRIYTERKKQNPREGAVLLIVLLIILMATSTAMFAISSSQFDQRASAAWHQATRTKYVAESATMALMAHCQGLTLEDCTGMVRDNGEILTNDLRTAYGLPSLGTEQIFSVTRTDLERNPNLFANGATDDTDLRLSRNVAGRGTVFLPSFLTSAERWKLLTPATAGAVADKYRIIVSTYGVIDVDPNPATAGIEDSRSSSEQRWGHQAVSITRAIIDER